MAVATDQELQWDGRFLPYIPPAQLRIHPSLRLHTETVDDVDPITHEVLRHALWNVNTEHGNVIIRTSGSPICAYGHDFNPVILDEEGGYVFFGKFNLYLAVGAGAAVKWTLEHRSENPGINPGDMFLTNDPWINATHQPDVTLIAPLFVGDELFCWVGNTLHQWDLGGTAPGGFNPIAEDLFWEAPNFRPVKIVEGGELRRDVEELYTGFSRLPELVALDLRAMITGNNAARARVNELVDRYGAAAVKATMRKLQDDSQVAFERRLASIPDGSWSEEGYLEVSLPGDRDLYLNRMTVTKRDGKLIFSNRGSAPQSGALSACYPAWRGGIVSMLAPTMLYDQMFAIEGALRCLDFDLEPGTISCATRPAAVSAGTAATLLHSMGMAGLAISKMLATSTDAELRTEIQSSMGVLGFPINAIDGVDQRGRPYVSFLNEPVGAALAASPWRDGQDTGGWPWDLQSTMPNVEDNELFYPILYLWRKEQPDSGGAGKYRGGNGAEGAVVPHKTASIHWSTVAAEVAMPAPGLSGGYPPSTNSYLLLHGAEIHAQLAKTGRMPTTPEEIGGKRDWVPAKSFDRHTTTDDVWVFAWSGAGGYGDPLEREPESVLADVTAGRVTAAWAKKTYGVVVDGSGTSARVDRDATARRRTKIRKKRLAEGEPWHGAREDDGIVPPDGPVSEYVRVENGEYRCGDVSLGAASGNYKAGALVRDLPVTDANPNIREPSIYTHRIIRFRQLICPQTGTLIDTEVPVDDTPPSWDVKPGR